MSVSIPYTFTGGPGNKARAGEVNADFQAIAAKFTEGAGGISDGDISSSAGIKGSKLSSVPGTRVTAAQLESQAVDSRVLFADAAAGSALAAVGSAAHIKNQIIPNSKLSIVGGERITLAQTEIVAQSQLVTFSGLIAGTAAIFTVTPLTPIPKATRTILGVYLSGLSAYTAHQSIVAVVDTSDATNYLFRITVIPAISGSFTGNLVVTFIPNS